MNNVGAYAEIYPVTSFALRNRTSFVAFGSNHQKAISYSTGQTISVLTSAYTFASFDVYRSIYLPVPYPSNCFDYQSLQLVSHFTSTVSNNA